MAKEFATYDDQAFAPGQKSHGLRVVNDDLALSGRSKEDPLAELARIIGNTDHYRESLRQNNRVYEEPEFAPPVGLEPAAYELRSETRQEPAFSASEFQPPVFEEHHWPEVSAPQPVPQPMPAAKPELEWDDLEAELASISARRQASMPPRPVEPMVQAPPSNDYCRISTIPPAALSPLKLPRPMRTPMRRKPSMSRNRAIGEIPVGRFIMRWKVSARLNPIILTRAICPILTVLLKRSLLRAAAAPG